MLVYRVSLLLEFTRCTDEAVKAKRFLHLLGRLGLEVVVFL